MNKIGCLFYLIVLFVIVIIIFSYKNQALLEPTLDDLLDAIEWVESEGDADASGHCGEIGAYQLTEIYIDDVNRILALQNKDKRYTYIDRWDRNKSRKITAIVIQHYGDGSFETMARTHKSPSRRYKDYTKEYWQKVKKVMEQKK